ncbi:hypothetical protein OOK29_25875 [Streptomyces phaeochromogenes]|uniref:hypothetical protein n=1 Tax=Streptomyces phaeochromogenes TaxID=1923 RepID=UPI00224CD741|nr:hypothetical protein [Streptomyces phaeochromogenes]MCX5601583.1 hypothetical protein [Streptomyces phaeochromogenes]
MPDITTETRTCYFIQSRPAPSQPWQPASGAKFTWESEIQALGKLAARREMQPNWEHRLMERTTTVTDRPQLAAVPGVVGRRKRPVDVDTIQWTGENEAAVQAFAGSGNFHTVDEDDRIEDPDITAEVWDTLHCTWVGTKTGQHVVRGVKGEYYPIDEDVLLAETYVLGTPS